MLYSLLAKKPVYQKNKIFGYIKDVNIAYATGKIIELIAGSFLKLKRENIPINKIKIKEDKILYIPESNKMNFLCQNESGEIGNIVNKEVYTERGDFLGKVKDFQIDLQFWRVADIRVKSLSSSKKLIIGEDQIVSMDEYKIVVKDGTVEDAIAGMAT